MSYITENIGSITMVVYCLIAGIIVAFAVSLVTRRIYGRLVDAIIKSEADSLEKAKTLDELGVEAKALLLRALSRKNVLTSLVSCDNDKAPVKERRFYITPEHQIKAQGIYGMQKLSPLSLVVAVVLFAVILFVFQYIIPNFFK